MRRHATNDGVASHPATAEPDYSDDEREFLLAMDEYKRRTGRQFPAWSEALAVLRELGYRKGDPPPPAEPPPPRPPRGPSAEEKARILELVGSGLTQRAVASALSMSEAKVSRIMTESGLVAPRAPRQVDIYRERVEHLARQGMAREQIAAVAGCHPMTAYRIIRAMRLREGDA